MVNIGRSGMWRPAVQPYLEELALELAKIGANENSIFVEVNQIRVLLTPLEQQLLLAMTEETGSDFARKHILVRDCVMDDSHTSPPFGAMFAVHMLVRSEGGGTFSFAELQEDLEAAGFEGAELARSAPDMSAVVQARKGGDESHET